MKRMIFLAVAMAAAMAAAQSPVPEQQPKAVHGEGCVEAGVEMRCLVIKDVKTGTLYNLLVKGARPEVGVGIEFTGTPFDGMTTCMQGKPLTVTSWTRKDSLKCVAPKGPQQ